MTKLAIKRFRVTNFRNVDDSGWIPLERVTAFVGRNESGKTTLLRALHKFNPANPDPYNPQREFPRDRFTRDFKGGADWTACAVEFALSPDFRAALTQEFGGIEVPSSVVFTRFYDGSLGITYDTSVSDDPVLPTELGAALDSFAKGARRLPAPSGEEEGSTAELRSVLANWALTKKEEAEKHADLKNPTGAALLRSVRAEENGYSGPQTADLVEKLSDTVSNFLSRAETQPISQRLDDAVKDALPVFIYFENYGVLDSTVYLPRFLEDLHSTPNDARVRTINAIFKHVGLTANDIQDLGQEEVIAARQNSTAITSEMIARDQNRKELRSVKLNSASLDITKRFSSWFGQRRHNIRYHADGSYFRIWVSDDRRPGVEIELESRSKGFQWFFSFYLIFLVESDEGHKDAILLLDEPGLSLHPTAQQELIAFFETLSERNPLLYSTHSPFLIDGERIHRVRPVTEDATGHSRISLDGWPRDRETIFPLQAAAGYAMVQGLFQHKKNILVEGMSDYLYLHALSLLCRATGRNGMPEDIYVTPCGGTKLVGQFASLFLGQGVRPIILLDGDDAGRVRRSALMKELYAGWDKSVLMLSDVLGRSECEIEDVVGDDQLLRAVADLVGSQIGLTNQDKLDGSLPDRIEVAASRLGLSLPDGWKPEVARRLSISWSTQPVDQLPVGMLDRAQRLFDEISRRF